MILSILSKSHGAGNGDFRSINKRRSVFKWTKIRCFLTDKMSLLFCDRHGFSMSSFLIDPLLLEEQNYGQLLYGESFLDLT